MASFWNLVNHVIEMSDILLLVIDARMVEETRNWEVENKVLSKQKHLLYVINKCDMVEFSALKQRTKGLNPKVFVSATKHLGATRLRTKLKILSKLVKKERHEKQKRWAEKNLKNEEAEIKCKGKKITEKECREREEAEEDHDEGINEMEEIEQIIPTPKKKRRQDIKIGVLGYPNVGKSSIINFLKGKASAGTSSESGFTRSYQYVKLNKEITLIDTPGVLTREDKQMGFSEKVIIGSIDYSKVKDPLSACESLIEKLGGIIEKYYDVKKHEEIEETIEEIAVKRHLLMKGGKPDTERAARMVLKDWQQCKIRI